MQINLFESIRIFIEIVESGSFTHAAENLQIHRPAVTKALQLLEQHCGTRLMQRTTRRINLTPDGEAFYRQSKPLLAQADALLESFGSDSILHGQLHVDMPVAFATLLVVPICLIFIASTLASKSSSVAQTSAGICCAMVLIAYCGWGTGRRGLYRP